MESKLLHFVFFVTIFLLGTRLIELSFGKRVKVENVEEFSEIKDRVPQVDDVVSLKLKTTVEELLKSNKRWKSLALKIKDGTAKKKEINQAIEQLENIKTNLLEQIQTEKKKLTEAGKKLQPQMNYILKGQKRSGRK